jgi:tellurite resistance protein TerC
MHPELFPWQSCRWLYGVFVLLVVAGLAFDLRVRLGHGSGGRRRALLTVILWIGTALLFSAGLYGYGLLVFPGDPRLAGLDPQVLARRASLEFLTGYLVEQSLSVDNLMIFLVIFDSFEIPGEYRRRILFLGILGAILFRGVFIALGSLLITFSWVSVVFGLFLFVTGLKVALAPEKRHDPSDSALVRMLRRFLPVSGSLHGGKFLVRESGCLRATPLLIVLLLLELTDILFAVDSVPAVFAVTREPFLVFTSNVFAILGLRSLFFVLADLVGRLRHLKYGLGFILCFVGCNMSWLDHRFEGGFPVLWSLGIILSALVVTAILSALFPGNRKETTRSPL